MLGLISMVTPVIYKKAAERTTEMQDINAASQVRVIVKAIDDYLRDNYTTITAGGTVTSQAAPDAVKSVDYSAYDFGANDADTSTKTTAPIDIEHFRDYLPLGFRPDGKLFKEFDVVIKQTRDPSGERKALTTVLVAKTSKDGKVDPAFTRLRSSRIASMIGTNGGFVDGDKATGVQGVWQIPKNELPDSNVDSGTIVATSIEAVADGTAGGKNVLHRVATPGRPEYNTMETALNMGGNDVNHLVNLIATADNQINVRAQTGDNNVLLHVDGQGLIDSTLKAASENFIAESGYMQHKSQLYVGTGNTAETAQFYVNGSDGSVRAASGNHTIDADGNTYQAGSAQIDGNAHVNGIGHIDGELHVRKHDKTNGTSNWKEYSFNVNDYETTNEGMFQSGKKSPYSAPSYWNDYNFNVSPTAASLEGSLFVSKLSNPIDGHEYGFAAENGGNTWIAGDLDLRGTFSAAYNENAYGDNTEKGAYNMQLAKDKFKTGASTSTSYPGYHLEVGNSTSDSVKLAATSKTNREGGTAATKYPAWKDHNLTVTPSYTYNEGTFYTGKRTSTTSTATENYKNWNSYNMRVFGTSAYIESDVYMQKLANGMYNTKSSRYSQGGPVFLTGYNSDAPKDKHGHGNRYMLEVTTNQAALGHLGGATILVNDYFDKTDGGKSIDIGIHGAHNDLYIMPTSTWGNGDERTTMYMRKGIIHLERNSDSTGDKSQPSSYIKADRLVTNVNDGSGLDGTEKQYEFQVNPAYTSMMHDIKLSTRGGARLSDILPDFINKGIYVMDNTYKGKSNWEEKSVGNNFVLDGLSECGATKCDTSAWLGFIPTPNCPPGYMKVATITPIRFAMAQAGVPIQVDGNGGIEGNTYSNSHYRVLGTRKDPRGDKVSVDGRSTGDTLVHVYPNGAGQNIEVEGTKVSNPAPEYWADVFNHPYTFQVSTWLNTTLKAYKPTSGFKGWHGIMGFIYPAKDYEDYLKAIGAKDDTTSISDTEIIWNLFPVYKEELSAIATVYCYFDRSVFSNVAVDQYLPHKAGSINAIRNESKAGSETYTDRLNDPTLKYDAVW